MKHLLTFLVRAYRYGVSPMLGSACRFHPSCSAYALEALERHGTLRGTWLACTRIARCHPWHPGGCDPVPGPIPGGVPSERPVKRTSRGTPRSA